MEHKQNQAGTNFKTIYVPFKFGVCNFFNLKINVNNTADFLILGTNKPGFRRCMTCELAACWFPLLFPSSPAFLEQTRRCRHMAGMFDARCCGTAGISRYKTSHLGVRSLGVDATPAAPMSGSPQRPDCEELRGRLRGDNENDSKEIRINFHFHCLRPEAEEQNTSIMF